MTQEEQLFYTLGQGLPNAEKSQMFGKPCFKIHKKAFVSFFENSTVFKLEGDKHKKAMALNMAKAFDPSGKNRPMKEWVQLSPDHTEQWEYFAKAAYDKVLKDNL
jgi:hypothetical protein